MRNQKFVFSVLSSSSAMALALALSSAPAFAQDVPLTLDPSGGAPASAPAPAGPSAGGGVDYSASAGAAGYTGGDEEGGAGAADAEPENFYYGDYLDDDSDDAGFRPAKRNNGAVPETHTVRSGDTLWDLSSYYFSDAWSWPKVWGLNPEISNPHWIYPGNIVRLREGGGTPTAQNLEGDKPRSGFGLIAAKAPQRSLGFHQMAYVDSQELKDAAKVDGATDAKALLATGDSIYVSYPEGKLPKVGATYSIYSQGKSLKRDGEDVGSYVLVKGELEITFAKEGKRARAVITRSVDPVERGMRVGPLKLKFGDVQPVPNSKQVDGKVVDVIGPDELIGAQAAVLLDRGSNDGVKAGNRFLVLRRGDAYKKVMKPSGNVGQDDDKYPARAIGEIIVVQTGKSASLGFVTFSIEEFEPGDRVYMRKGQ
jgi:hypothetical protein